MSSNPASILEFTRTLLERCNIKPKQVDAILRHKSTIINAFTHSSIDEINNYEYLEYIGDRVLNSQIHHYFEERYGRDSEYNYTEHWITNIVHSAMSAKVMREVVEMHKFDTQLRIEPGEYENADEAAVWQKKYAEVREALERAEALWMAALEKLEKAQA